jgi:hypothetical protein
MVNLVPNPNEKNNSVWCPRNSPLSWWGRLIKNLSDLFDEFGTGGIGAPATPFDPSRRYASWDL